jgi:F-type H+-transporting ATPase subunit delta
MASVTSTYARAFADVIFMNRLDAARTVQEAESLAQLVSGNRELREVLGTPSIAADQKHKLIDTLAARLNVSKPVRNLLAVLIDHQRVRFLSAITKQFGHEVNRRMGFAEADIVSARELSAAEHSSLESQVELLTRKKVRARYSQDSSLLGGAVVKIGSTIYDGSVKGQLERIKAALIGSS